MIGQWIILHSLPSEDLDINNNDYNYKQNTCNMNNSSVSDTISAKLWRQNCIPCINSKSLLMTVLRNRQCMRRNLGYCPTMYMMFDAMIALLSFPLFCSQRPSKSFITITKNLFSSSSGMAPLMDPTAQHKVLRFLHDHSLPLTCR